jgi:uncharacterized protein YqjF (DUF2071 family)
VELLRDEWDVVIVGVAAAECCDMKIPVITGIIKRRLLVNFRADPDAVQRILPQPFRPKLQNGNAIVGICLIRLEQIRPACLPGALGLASENAAHRIAVEWTDSAGLQREGVYIPRRDTSSLLNRMAGGRVFPGEHHPARFSVIDIGGHIELSVRSLDDAVSVKVVGDETDSWPASSCFESLGAASAFFEGGSLGYSATSDGDRLDGMLLRTMEWRLRALSISELESSFFADQQRFPKGSIEFDHALIMRDLRHEWHKADDLYTVPRPSEQKADLFWLW